MIDTKPGLRAVIYARVSEDDQRKRRSVGEQEQECREAAHSYGFVVDHPAFVDNDRSASRYARRPRPAYQELLKYLASGKADVLILWESSRGGRELEGWANLLNVCREAGVAIHVVTHRRTYDLENSRDWRTLAEDGVDSAYESEKTRERIMRSVRASAASGKPHGKLLYGYRRTYDDRGNFIAQVANEDQAAIVKEAAQRVAEGEACYAIAQDFNARGIPTSRGGAQGWSLSQIRRMVTNPGYIAQRVHQGKVVGPAAWPPILDEETYTVCVARLTDEKRRTFRDGSLKHLLSGIAKCAVCGSRTRLQKNRTHFAYMCHSAFHISVRHEKLDEFITAVVFDRLSRPDALELLAPPEDGDEAAQAAAEAAEKRARLDEFYAAAARGEVSPTGLAHIEGQLLPEIEAAEERARSVLVPPLVRGLIGPNVAERWEGLTIGQRREVISLLMEIRVGRTYRGARTFDPKRLAESRWRGDSETWGDRGLV